MSHCNTNHWSPSVFSYVGGSLDRRINSKGRITCTIIKRSQHDLKHKVTITEVQFRLDQVLVNLLAKSKTYQTRIPKVAKTFHECLPLFKSSADEFYH